MKNNLKTNAKTKKGGRHHHYHHHRHHNDKHKRTLKDRINKHILNQKDICCEEYFEREKIINQIIELYTKYVLKLLNQPKEEIPESISNDISLLIFKNSSKNIKLSNDIDKQTKTLEDIKILLKEIPLYLLLSLLAYANIKANAVNQLNT